MLKNLKSFLLLVKGLVTFKKCTILLFILFLIEYGYTRHKPLKSIGFLGDINIPTHPLK